MKSSTAEILAPFVSLGPLVRLVKTSALSDAPEIKPASAPVNSVPVPLVPAASAIVKPLIFKAVVEVSDKLI